MAKKKINYGALILVIIFVAGLITAGIIFKDELKILFSGKKYYTQSQVNEAYNAGLNEGKENNEYYLSQIEALEKENTEKEKILNELLNNIESQTQINNNLKGQNSLLGNTLNNLLEKENNLQAQADVYANEIPSYLEEDECLVKFNVKGNIEHFLIVEKGSTLTETYNVIFEEGCYDIFNYWQLNGIEVNPVGYTVNDNVEFVANITPRYLIWTTVNGNRTSNIVENVGDIPTPTGRFIGWKLNDVLIDLTEIQLENNLELVAVFQQAITTEVRILLMDNLAYPEKHVVYETTQFTWYAGDSINLNDINVDGNAKPFNGKTYNFGGAYFAQESNIYEAHNLGNILLDNKTFGEEYAEDIIVVIYYINYNP